MQLSDTEEVVRIRRKMKSSVCEVGRLHLALILQIQQVAEGMASAHFVLRYPLIL